MAFRKSDPSDPYLWKFGPRPTDTILHNKLDIKDIKKLRAIETELSRIRMEALMKYPIKGNFDQKHVQSIHRFLVQDVYHDKPRDGAPAIAGAIRIDGVEKPSDLESCTRYPNPRECYGLQARLDYAFAELKRDNDLKGLESNPYEFSTRLAHHVAELWSANPFRIGNTLMSFVLAHHITTNAGMEFNSTSEDRQAFRQKLEAYARGDRKPLIYTFRKLVEPEKPDVSLSPNRQKLSVSA